MKKIATLILAGLLGAAAQASGQASAQAPAQPPTQHRKAVTPKTGTSPKAGTTASTGAARSYDRALLRPAALKEKAPDTYQVKFATSRGDFTVTVTRAWSPYGADRFYHLVKHHFYDNASFFRVLPGFVAQFGISAYPPVSAAWIKANIKDDAVTQSNKKGYLSFATGGPNTRTTQVFINLADNARLDASGFSPFGRVTEGMNVVDMFYEGYGEGAPSGGGPDQDKIQNQGKPYLDKGWPKLDYIKTTTLIAAPSSGPATPAPAKKPAPAAAKKPQ